MKSNEELAYLLAPCGEVAQIGPEKTNVARVPQRGVMRYCSAEGSHRFVRYQDGVAVGALQVMAVELFACRIANVYTKPEFRRHGVARDLLHVARHYFARIYANNDMSDDGRRWVEDRMAEHWIAGIVAIDEPLPKAGAR